ncbi:hypothetical protein C1Y40_00018 [Mycobacterium talmoniae]|uniref:Uncharacterized protein n=1 Tax=Mycobacterium talmoniae TaxID=1858794 RepID=A0A2S8BSU7_9MYCO|nr:hypothetical protein C1Y40_00018 [Mycobacterium talmoniae]
MRITFQPMPRPRTVNNNTNAAPVMIRRRVRGGGVGVSTCGATLLGEPLRGLMAEARPAAVLGTVS